MKTRVLVQRKNGFVYLRLFAGTDDSFQEIGKIFAGTEKAVPQLTGREILKKVADHGPFIHDPGRKLVTIPATAAEVIQASRHFVKTALTVRKSAKDLIRGFTLPWQD